MNTPSENAGAPGRLPVLAEVSLLLGGILSAAMSLALFLAVVLNASALYRAEVHSIEIITATFGGAATPVVLFAAAWVPVVICIVALAIVIGGVAILIWTTWVQQLLAFIRRQAALCATVP